jgi:hypothetical protein
MQLSVQSWAALGCSGQAFTTPILNFALNSFHLLPKILATLKFDIPCNVHQLMTSLSAH